MTKLRMFPTNNPKNNPFHTHIINDEEFAHIIENEFETITEMYCRSNLPVAYPAYSKQIPSSRIDGYTVEIFINEFGIGLHVGDGFGGYSQSRTWWIQEHYSWEELGEGEDDDYFSTHSFSQAWEKMMTYVHERC